MHANFSDKRQPIEFIDGAFSVVNEDGSTRPLRMHGVPLAVEGPEWFLDSFYPGTGSLRVVQWRRMDGSGAVHYYTPELDFMAAGFGQLTSRHRSYLVELCIQPLDRLWSELICNPEPNSAPLPDDFCALGPNAREEIASHLWPVLHRQARQVVLGDTPQSQWPSMPLSFDLVEQVFARDFLDFQIEAMKAGALRLTDNETLSCHSGIFLQVTGFTAVYAYRFSEPVHSEVFYLVCADWNYAAHCLYFPQRELVVYPNGARRSYLDGVMPRPVDRALFEGVAKHSDLLNNYIPAGNDHVAVFSFYRHIGHHLWNELTGLDRALGAAQAPVYSVGSKMSEMYGALDALFPNCSGSVDRSVENLWDLPRVLYQKRIGFLHPTGDKITKRLQRRILGCAESSHVTRAARDQYTLLQQQGFRVILIGLRVENRTLVDLFYFCREVMKILTDELRKVAFIIDGHNVSSPGGKPYQTIGNSLGVLRPEDAEYAVLDQLREAFAHDPRVKIISTIGEPVAVSLWWGARGEFFVTPWGAGLAKYRWVCNLPGVVVSSRSFLSHPESRLYDSDRYLEEPAKTFRIEPDEAVDLPDAHQLVKLPGEGRHNFLVDMGAVIRELRAAVAWVSASEREAAEACDR